MPPPGKAFKRPESVLVVVHTAEKVLLLQRADDPEFWQSVTGAMEWGEASPHVAAVRELREETGLPADSLQDLNLSHRFPILPRWRARYAPEVDENTEHAFALPLSGEVPVQLSAEHVGYGWFTFAEAARRVHSWTNRSAIETVGRGR